MISIHINNNYFHFSVIVTAAAFVSSCKEQFQKDT